jgi:hypothetical protein
VAQVRFLYCYLKDELLYRLNGVWIRLGYCIGVYTRYIPGDIYIGISGIQVSTFNWVIKSQLSYWKRQFKKIV